MQSCQITHSYSGTHDGAFCYPEIYEAHVSYSKIIIYNIVSMETYGHPNVFCKFTNIIPPPGLFPSEYNYWDYIDAFEKVFWYRNPHK